MLRSHGPRSQGRSSEIGSQKAGTWDVPTNPTYSLAELGALIAAGIDVIANPGAGGVDMWTCRAGHNSSSSATVWGDNYTRMTNYIAATLDAGMGGYGGQVINSDLLDEIDATLKTFLTNLLGQGLLGSEDGSTPFAEVCEGTNTPPARTSLGYVQADVQVQYQAINE